MSEETTTLRDAARRLARAKNPKGKGIQSTALFDLLRAGKLRAGFYILEGSAWVEVPIGYWEALAVGQFRRIARETNDLKSGSFRLRGDQFPDQIAKIISDQIQIGRQGDEATLKRISDVVAMAGKRIEVTVKTADITNFLRSLGLDDHVAYSAGGGRRQKEGWRDISSYMAAYMVAHYRSTPEAALKVEISGDAIYNLARQDGVPDIPVGSTIKEQISKALALLEKLSLDGKGTQSDRVRKA
jgi:hypothetical protein